MYADHPEQPIIANCFHFHRILQSAYAAAAQGKFDVAAGLAQHAAYFAWFNSTGYMASRELEDLLLDIGHRTLPAPPVPPPRQTKKGPLRILHVLTASYGVGGHTRLAWRWINNDRANRHSVILTQQGTLPIPPQLENAARNAGGSFTNLEARGVEYLDRAQQLRSIADQHDLIVLHQHPHDVVPTIAFASLSESIPVLYLNHVSYVFWIGVSVSNQIVNLAKGCIDFCVERRGIPRENCSALLPIPIDLPRIEKSRADIRRRLGISEQSTIIFSSGSAHKYTPVNGTDFRDFVRSALSVHSDCHLLIAGPINTPYWEELAQAAPGRIHPLGLIDEQAHHSYCAASDIYLDSIPLGSGTSILEAACLGLPVLVYAPPEWKHANLSFEQDNIPRSLHFFDDKQAYIRHLEVLIEDPAARRYFGNAVSGFVRRASMGTVWKTMLSDAYNMAFESPRRRPSGESLFFRATETDLFFNRLQTAAGNTQQVDIPEFRNANPEAIAALLDLDQKSLAAIHGEQPYGKWMSRRSLDNLDADIFKEHVQTLWQRRPLFEFFLILKSGNESLLADSIDSLAQQFYEGWRLSIFAQLPSPEPEFNEENGPIRWIQLADQKIEDTVNARLLQSKADWVGFFECGSRLVPQLLLVVGDYIALHPEWSLIYSDEDAIDDRGERSDPLFKPDFNLELLRATDYIGSIFVKRHALISLGGYPSVANGECYDIALRLADSEGELAIGHLPDVLYHVPSAAFARAGDEAAVPALERHLARRKLDADILRGSIEGTTRRVLYSHPAQPKVSIIIPTRNRLDLLGPCVESLLKNTDYPDWELVLVDNNSDDPAVNAYYESLCAALPDRVRLLRHPGPFDFAAMNNQAAEDARGDYLLLLNNDTECIHDDWLSAMMAHAQRPDVGIVGARLLFPGSLRVQHAGVVLGLSGTAGHVFVEELTHEDPGYLGRALVDQEYSAVSGACLLIRTTLYREIGGLDEQAFKISFNDIDLCLKARERGYRIIWTPFATLLHHGSASQLADQQNPEKARAFRNEADTFHDRWQHRLTCDPAWNRNLSLSCTTPTLEDELAVPWNTDFHDRPRILIMPTASMGAAEYRNLGPLRALHDAGRLHYAAVCQPTAERERAPTPVELARLAPDTLVMHAPVDNVRCLALLQYKVRNPDIFRIYSLDDLITNLPRDNPVYHALPGPIISERLQLGLAACHRMIVSTEPLLDACRHLIDDIRLLPNRLSLTLWGDQRSLRRTGKKLRVGWAGAQQHAGDLRFVLDVVKATCQEVDWIFFGMLPEGAKPYVAEFHDYVHRLNEYPAKLASLNLDLAIAPLEIHPFNEAKSNLRLLEYGILGWPVICSDILPYRTDNPPVLRLPNDAARWIAAIRERVADPDALARDGDALQAWVRRSYILEDHLDPWFAALTR